MAVPACSRGPPDDGLGFVSSVDGAAFVGAAPLVSELDGWVVEAWAAALGEPFGLSVFLSSAVFGLAFCFGF